MIHRDQGLQNWTVGTLKSIKLIGMNSRFAKICTKAQEQKWPIFSVKLFNFSAFMQIFANLEFIPINFSVQSTSSPILNSLVFAVHIVGGYLSLCYAVTISKVTATLGPDCVTFLERIVCILLLFSKCVNFEFQILNRLYYIAAAPFNGRCSTFFLISF